MPIMLHLCSFFHDNHHSLLEKRNLPFTRHLASLLPTFHTKVHNCAENAKLQLSDKPQWKSEQCVLQEQRVCARAHESRSEFAVLAAASSVT